MTNDLVSNTAKKTTIKNRNKVLFICKIGAAKAAASGTSTGAVLSLLKNTLTGHWRECPDLGFLCVFFTSMF